MRRGRKLTRDRVGAQGRLHVGEAVDGGRRRNHGRHGGEEFCLLLPNFNAARALQVGETVRAAIQDLGILHAQRRAAAVRI
jgi:GGDEF domain-containing protein